MSLKYKQSSWNKQPVKKKKIIKKTGYTPTALLKQVPVFSKDYILSEFLSIQKMIKSNLLKKIVKIYF